MGWSNRRSVAVDDFVTAGIQIEMLANDTGPDGDPITVIWHSLAENGYITLDGASTIYISNGVMKALTVKLKTLQGSLLSGPLR